MGRKARAKAARRKSDGAKGPGRPVSPEIAPIEAIKRLGASLYKRRNPLEVEISLSGLIAQLVEGMGADPEIRASLFRDLIDDAERSADPPGLAVLHGLAALFEEPLAGEAQAGVMRLRSAGVADPRWAGILGRYDFVRGWSAADELGDQEIVCAEFESEGGAARHAITFMVDANFDGLLREAGLALDAAAARRVWESAPEGTLLPIVERSAQETADKLGRALEVYEEYLDPPSSRDVRDLAALLKARLRVLPPARERVLHEVSAAEREALMADFARSMEASHSKKAREIAPFFIDYKVDYSDGDPLRWSPLAVELCLLDWFPGKITMDAVSLRRVPDALRRWVRYAARRKGLREELLAETLDAIDEFEPQFLDAMNDERGWGPAKGIVAALERDGVDITDQAAVSRWIEDFNNGPIEERDRVLGPMGVPARPPAPDGAIAGDEKEDVSAADAATQARRAWAVPRAQGTYKGIELSWLDQSDADDRRLLIEAEHPEFYDALEEDAEIEGPHGTKVNPRLHMTIHEIVANQLWNGDPPEAWEAAQRLIAKGYDRHEVLHRLMRVVSDSTFEVIEGSAPPEEIDARLRAAFRSPGARPEPAARLKTLRH